MLHELSPTDYDSVRDLFAPLDFQLCTTASLDRTAPARILVSEPDAPASALLHGGEGSFFAGAADDPVFNAALRQHITDDLFSSAGAGWRVIYGAAAPDWQAQYDAIFAGHKVYQPPRRHYICTELAYTNWRDHLPEGFTIQRVTPERHECAQGVKPDAFDPYDWWEGGFHTLEDYFARGNAHCVLHEGAWVAWCIPDCYSHDGRIEVGIFTLPDFRRRGLAACVVAAAVEGAFEMGYREVGWHCDDDNHGSYHTAEKVGFVKERDYAGLIIVNGGDGESG